MHLRRALLLFAIVLGLAALAAAISRPTNVDDEPAPRTTPQATAPSSPTISDGAASLPPTDVAFDAAEPRSRKLEAGRAATVTVAVDEPGMITIPGLGLTAPAGPLTPARFDVLVREPGDLPIDYTPAGETEALSAGTLVITAPDA